MIKAKCISGKNTYSSADEAKKAAELGMFLSKERNLSLHVYHCIDCYEYHLTSRDRSKNSSRKR